MIDGYRMEMEVGGDFVVQIWYTSATEDWITETDFNGNPPTIYWLPVMGLFIIIIVIWRTT